MRRAVTCSLVLALALISRELGARQPDAPLPSCPARVSTVGDASVQWIAGPEEDRATLNEWCRAVGPPLYIPVPAHIGAASPERAGDSTRAAAGGIAPPALDDLVVLTWNAHLAEGRLDDLVEDLREGDFTGGRPVQHFVLLLQELYRRGTTVPDFTTDVRSAKAIRPRDPKSADVRDQALALGLSLLYAPSMRNGADSLEDRGNAILSTESLSNALVIELPFERQRRVAVGAAIQVTSGDRTAILRVVNAHLDPLSSARSLWVFRNPRPRQTAMLLDLLRVSRFEDDVAWTGTVLGGDLNTVQAGMDEPTYRDARAWSRSLVQEDRRTTHPMGRLDYLFFRLAPGWAGSSVRLDKKFGSDHYPVLGRFARTAAP